MLYQFSALLRVHLKPSAPVTSSCYPGSEPAGSQLPVRVCLLVMPGMFMRRSNVSAEIGRRADLTAETQQFEKEQANSIWPFAQLLRLGFGFVTVCDSNLVRLIRIARPSAHPSNATGERPRPPCDVFQSARSAGGGLRLSGAHIGFTFSALAFPVRVPEQMRSQGSGTIGPVSGLER
jgi:hypothetical protein